MMSSNGESEAPGEILLKELLDATEKRQREVVRLLGTSLKVCNEWNAETESTTQGLIERYLTLPSKSSLKPYILSYLDSSDSRICEDVQKTLAKSLTEKLKSPNAAQRRIVADGISRLLESKCVGFKVINGMKTPVLDFLLWCVKSAHEDSAGTEDSLQFNDAMTDIKVSVHTLNKFLQKTDMMYDNKQTMERIFEICVSVIKQENALLDCQTSCAMTIPLVYKVLYRDQFVQCLLRDLFEKPRPEFKVSNGTVETYFCLLTGLVGGLNRDDLITSHNDGGSILSLAMEKIFEAYDNIQEATKSKFALSRCLVVLTAKIQTCSKEDLPNFHLMQKRLLHYVYDHLEDPVDAIRHQAKNVFDNVIKTHVKFEQNSEELVDLATDLLSMDWHRKGKYSLLAILSVHVETSILLTVCPDLPTLMLSALDEGGMSNYVSDLYDKLMVNHKKQVSDDVWHRTWLDPVVGALSDAELRHGIIVFVLPKVLEATKSGMKYIIPTLVSGEIHSDSLLVLVSCLKRARCLGFLTPSDNEELWNDVLPLKLLTQALEHSDASLRTEAFGLLCLNAKTTALIPKYDLDLILDFLLNNLTNQSPATRQEILSAFRKMLARFKDSWVFFHRTKAQEEASHYAKFVVDLFDSMLKSIYAGVSFTRRSCALSVLVYSVAILKDTQPALPTLDSVASEAHVDNLFQILADTFEENKANAFDLLLHVDAKKMGLDSPSRVGELLTISDELIVTTRPQDCTTAAYLHKLLIQQPNFFQAFDSDLENSFELRQLLLLEKLSGELKRQVEQGKTDLIRASVHAPMYPVLHCVRYLLNKVDHGKLKPELWHDVLSAFVESSFDACAVVSPVISHASPEGNVPVSELIVSDGDDDCLSTVQDMPEFLVVCSWRTVKEVALLLGDLSSWPVRTETQSGFVTVEMLLRIGKFYTNLLLESRHRGAFELAYAGFQPMCSMLWSSKLESMNHLPQQWLKQILEDIEKSDEEGSRLCATRRSAGVPFFVLALVVTEPASRGRKCLSQAMKSLLDLAQSEKTLCHIHALNCLRALYKDNRLGEVVLGYVSEGVRISILGFSAESWAVRNASTLLFSALMVRVFGVRRDRNVLCSKNSLSGRVFFYRYPALFPFLLERLSQCTDNIATLNPGLYPILMVLGRLTPSILEGSDTAMNVAEFIPHVMRCAGSPVQKTREMGAKALCPIVFKDQLEPILEQICQSLETSSSQNLTHGLLLQLLYLLDDAFVRKIVISDDILRRIYKSNWLMGRRNKCYTTRGAYIQVLTTVIELANDERFHRRLLDDVLVTIHLETASLPPAKDLCHTYFMTDLISLYAKKCRDFDEGRLLAFLSGHRLYEIREITLKCLKDNTDLLPDNLVKRLEKEEHPSCLALLMEILACQSYPVPDRIRELRSRHHGVISARLRYLAGSGNSDDGFNLVSDLLELCQPEQVFESRLACADALYKMRRLLLDKTPLQTQLWAVCIALLLDDDDDVRSRVCDVIGELTSTDPSELGCLSHSVGLNRAITLMLHHLSPSDCITMVTEVLRGPDKKNATVERLFDKGEHSTYEDRLHLILLVLEKFDDHCRSARFTFCDKLVSGLFKSISTDFSQCLSQWETTERRRLLDTIVYTEQFCDNFGLFSALYVLNRIRTMLRMAEFDPTFDDFKSRYFALFPLIMWPLSRFN